MFGVILWSDPLSGSAVIWSEDQGDLAYFDAGSARDSRSVMSARPQFNAGDLVEFDMTLDGQRFMACNPQVVGAPDADTVIHTLEQPQRSGMPRHAQANLSATDDAPVIDLQAHRAGLHAPAQSLSRRG